MKEETTTDELIEGIASRVRALRLETPVLLALESHLPLVTIGHTVLAVAAPILSLIVGPECARRLPSLLESRETVERLISRIECRGEPSPPGDAWA